MLNCKKVTTVFLLFTICLLLVGLFVKSTALAKSTNDIVGEYKVSSEASWARVLDIPGASKSVETPLNIFAHNGTKAQIFDFIPDEDGIYTIKNINSGLVLDVSAGKTEPGTKVQQYEANGSKAQKWKLEAYGNGYYIKSLLGNLVLDVSCANDANGTHVNVYTPNGTTAQIWHFTQSDMPIKFADTPLVDNSYVVSPLCAGTKVLDISCGSKSREANAQIYDCNRSSAQTFKFTHNENGYYTIQNINSSMVLDVSAGRADNCTNVQQYPSNGSLAQSWICVKKDDGSYVFYSALKKNLCLDVFCAGSTNATNVDVYTFNGTKAQAWKVYDPQSHGAPGLKELDNGWYNIQDKKTNLVVDVPNASRDAGTPLQMYEKNDSLAQIFYFDWQSGEGTTGFYKIYVGCGENLALTIKEGSLLPGVESVTKVTNKDEALWSIIKVNDITYLQNKASGLYLSVSNKKVVGNIIENASDWNISSGSFFSEGLYTISSSLNRNSVIDVPSASRSENTRLQIYNLNNSLAQKFKAVKLDDGSYDFQCLASGLWLGVDSSSSICQKSKPDHWIVDINKGYYRITHCSSKKVIDLSGANTKPGTKIVAYTINNTKAQCWEFHKVSHLIEGISSIYSSLNTSKCFDVDGASFSNHARLQTYQYNNTGAQAFVAENHSDGTISFRSARSKKFIDVPDWDAKPGKALQQYDRTNSTAQKWILELTDDCYIILRSAINKDLVIDAGASGDGTTLTLAHYDEQSKSQKFIFKSSEYPDVDYASRVQLVCQNPELPWGCESVALTELLTGMGYYEGKTCIADSYIGYSDWDFVNCYAGNPYQATGIGSTMPPCISNAGNAFLRDHGNGRFHTNIATGTGMGALIERAQCGYPSVVWTTISMSPAVVKWGDILWGYQVYQNLHAVCLCGYDSNTDSLLIADPIDGMVWRPRGAFEDIYNRAGLYSVVLD